MQLLKRDSVNLLLEEIYLGHQRLLINMQVSSLCWFTNFVYLIYFYVWFDDRTVLGI
jgi:hypothetical protein